MTPDESRLILPSRPDSLKPLLAFAREKARGFGFPEKGQKEVELALEEAVTNVIEHAYEPGEHGRYEVVFARRPGQVLISVEDQGRRFDMGGESGIAGLGFVLMKAFAQEIRFSGLGERGKRVEIVKPLPGRSLREYERAGKDPLAQGEPEPDSPVDVRPGTPEDVLGIARCIHRNGGWAGALEGFSFPDNLREMLGAGLLESCVAASPRGGVAGIWAFLRHPEASPVAEAGGVILDPAFRGGHLGEDLVFLLLERARATGATGLLAETPASGMCLSGMAVLPFSASETGVLLGGAPSAPAPVEGENRNLPGATLLEFVKLGDGVPKEIYPPFHHATMLRKIYEKCKLPRAFGKASPGGDGSDRPACAQLEVHMRPSEGLVRVFVREYGTDLLDRLYPLLQGLDRRGARRVHLDLPLSDPRTASLVAPAEALGFCFAGVVPELYGEDMLRLQHLAPAPGERPDLPGLTEFGEELLDYVWKGVTS